MTTLRPLQRARTTWRVLGRTAVNGEERALVLGGFAATCGHYHPTREEAEACPWEPAIAPGQPFAGIVREVRDDREDLPRPAQGRLFADTAVRA